MLHLRQWASIMNCRNDGYSSVVGLCIEVIVLDLSHSKRTHIILILSILYMY